MNLERMMEKAHSAAEVAIQRIVRDLPESEQREVFEYVVEALGITIEAMASCSSNKELTGL